MGTCWYSALSKDTFGKTWCMKHHISLDYYRLIQNHSAYGTVSFAYYCLPPTTLIDGDDFFNFYDNSPNIEAHSIKRMATISFPRHVQKVQFTDAFDLCADYSGLTSSDVTHFASDFSPCTASILSLPVLTDVPISIMASIQVNASSGDLYTPQVCAQKWLRYMKWLHYQE